MAILPRKEAVSSLGISLAGDVRTAAEPNSGCPSSRNARYLRMIPGDGSRSRPCSYRNLTSG